MLESNDNNDRIYFLGALKLQKDYWKLRFSFERTYSRSDGVSQGAILESAQGWAYGLGYASSDIIEFNIKEGEFVYFADYLGKLERKEVKEDRVTKKLKYWEKNNKTKIIETYKEVEKIEIISIDQFEIQCVYHYND